MTTGGFDLGIVPLLQASRCLTLTGPHSSSRLPCVQGHYQAGIVLRRRPLCVAKNLLSCALS
jgi:hypothetical protein